MTPGPSALPAVAALAAGLLLGVTGCGGNDEDDGGSLAGTEWTLVSGIEAPPDAVLTVGFDEERAGGFSGCNSFGVDYELEGDAIAIGEELAATTVGCEDPELERAESAYLAVFAAVDGWAIVDEELVLYANGEEALRYAAAAPRP